LGGNHPPGTIKNLLGEPVLFALPKTCVEGTFAVGNLKNTLSAGGQQRMNLQFNHVCPKPAWLLSITIEGLEARQSVLSALPTAQAFVAPG
jgi:hypothetical protein